MISSSRWFQRGGFTAVAACLILLIAACSSDPGPGRPPGPKDSKRKPPPSLAGQEVFFDGKILAEINVGATVHGGPGGDKSSEGSPGRGPGGHGRHGGGGGGFGGGAGGPGGPGGGGPPGGDPEDAQAMATRRAAMAGTQPPVLIHLKLTNQGGERLTLAIPDFISPLGNFVIQPEKLSLDPGQSREVEPMTSRLAGDIEETTVALTLHIPGRKEKKVLTLHAVAPPAAAPGPEPRPTQK